MTKHSHIAPYWRVLAGAGGCKNVNQDMTKNVFYPAVIPKPARITLLPGRFVFSDKTSVCIQDTAELPRAVLDVFIENVRQLTGLVLRSDTASASCIFLSRATEDPGREGYNVIVEPQRITINASTPGGWFYGLQSLVQCLLPRSHENPVSRQPHWSIACMHIIDHARFAWRGLHLDCGRHFFTPGFIKKMLDAAARYKINTFHWHLTEDQGWRIEIKKYPDLTRIGSRRAETNGNGIPHAGFYTQKEIRDIVRYAADRCITVVPEIELPGHCLAALAAYPQYSCTGGPFAVATTWGIFEDVYCAGKEETFAFLQDVLSEVIGLFPSPLIHIGGDECLKARWSHCPDCQKRLDSENLANWDELQSYFIRRIAAFLHNHGKKIIGWDEILQGGLVSGAGVMSWRGKSGGITAARQGHPVVMCPTDSCYFDYYQARTGEPKAFGQSYLPLEKVYRFEPVPKELQETEKENILGGQANVWSEYIPDFRQAEYMLFPRLCAMSEVLWSAHEHRDLRDFLSRLDSHKTFFDHDDINARAKEFVFFSNSAVSFTTSGGLAEILPAAGARLGTEAVKWTLIPGIENSLSWNFEQPLNLKRLLFQKPVHFYLKAPADCRYLRCTLTSARKHRIDYTLTVDSGFFDQTWHRVLVPAECFSGSRHFSELTGFCLSAYTDAAHSSLYLSEVGIGEPDPHPPAETPLVLFDGYDFNQTLYQCSFFNAASASGIAHGRGQRPGSSAIRIASLSTHPVSISWHFDPLIDLESRSSGSLCFSCSGGDSVSISIALQSRGAKQCRTIVRYAAKGRWQHIRIPIAALQAEEGFSFAKINRLDMIFTGTDSDLFYVTDLVITNPVRARVSGLCLLSEMSELNMGTGMEQNTPNPFKAKTRITYYLEKDSAVQLLQTDLTEKSVRSLVNCHQPAGWHPVDVCTAVRIPGFFKLIAGKTLYVKRFQALS